MADGPSDEKGKQSEATEEGASRKKQHIEGPEDSLVHNVYDRFLSRWFHTHHSRVVAGNVIIASVLIFSIALGVATVWLDINSEKLKGLGFFGIFFLNFVSTSTFFIPVPGLTAAGQALIVSEAVTLGAWQVGLVGGIGMGLGEITAYIAGAGGREIAQGRQVGGPQWFRTAVNKTILAISWLMRRYGMITLFILAAIPNPVFEIAGLTAGAVRMKFWRFLGPVLAGKILRGIALAYLGEISLHAFGI
jgi:membrane protein YqaA with SNARE-associated domain